MSTVGYGTLEVIPSVKGMRRDLERQTSSDLAAAGRTGGKKFGDSAGKEAASGFRSKFSGAMRGFAPLAGLVGGASIVAGFKDAINGASDLAESTSKAQVVFGEASESVLKFGRDAQESLGQSEAQALSAAGTFGNLLRSVGLSEEVAAQFSTTMVGLASDLASFNNTSVDDALEALRAGLVGETEPLKKFGVNMNEAVLKTKALELGLSDGKKVLDSNAKAQAAYAVIMEQTTLAQGDFARTSDGLANQQKILGAQWEEMTTAVGEELLPAVTGFVTFLNDKGLPALSATGGLAKDAVSAFASMPPPILAAAGAFGALRIASATGIADGLQAGVGRASSSMDGLRIRTMLARDAFVQARAASITLKGPMAGVNLGASRTAASMKALGVASQGAGTAMRTGLSKTMDLVGGPWGAAMIGATALVTALWQEHEKAKAQIDAFNSTLDESTGRATEQTYREAGKAIEGWADAASKAGISGAELTTAIVEGGDALEDVTRRFAEYQNRNLRSDLWNAVTNDAKDFESRVESLHDKLGAGREAWRLSEEAASAFKGSVNDSAEATDEASSSMRDYGSRADGARTALTKLIEKESERALAAIQNRRDAIALKETLAAAREEMREGKRTLDENTKAGRENMKALLDLGDQWNESSGKVTNAKGAYAEMRRDFIRVAEQMGATKEEARKLADEVLRVPKTAPIEFQSKGYQKRLAEIRRLKSEMEQITGVLVFQEGGSGKARRAFASGGKIGGEGTGTSDDNLIWASRGEWVIRERAAAYYGDAFMRRLNSMQLPKFATGGPVSGGPAAAPSAGYTSMFDFRGAQIVAHDYDDFTRKMQRRAQMAQSDGVRMGVPG